MALPVTISGGGTGPQNSYHGPFKSSGGNFYTILVRAAPDDSDARAFKATDPTSNFTAQDTVNEPLLCNSSVDVIKTLNVYQDGDNLHVTAQSNANTTSLNPIYYARFDMSADAWVSITGSDRDIRIDGAPNGTAIACDIAILSASYGVGSAFVKIRVVYQGAIDMDMGTNYERIDESNSVDDGENWSAPTQIDNGASVVGLHYTGPRVVLPPSNSDQCHIFMSDGTNLTQRAIAGDDTLRTYRDTGFDVTADDYPITHGIGFLRSSVSKVRIGYREITTNDIEVLEFDAFTDDTDRSETSSNISTDDVQVDSGSIVACLAADGSIIRGLMVKFSDDDLYEFFDDDADSYTLQGTAHRTGTFNHVSNNVYDRSGLKLAMIYDDGGTVYYDEISLAVAFDPDIDAFRFYSDGTEDGSSPKAAEDTDIELDATGDAQFHLRYRIQNLGAGAGDATDDYALEVSKNSGSFVAITGASSNVQSDTASGLTADAATTNRATNGLSDGTGSFVAGEQEETNGVIENHQLTASNFTEHVWACKLIDSDLGAGDTLDFRITLNGGAPGITNSVLPRITTPTVGPPVGTLALLGVGV